MRLTRKILAGRDVVARSMMTEIREGRGCDGPWGPHIKLKLDHLGRETLEKRLPGVCDLSKTFAHVDPAEEPIPVIPTCHYQMGGVPCNVNGQALNILTLLMVQKLLLKVYSLLVKLLVYQYMVQTV